MWCSKWGWTVFQISSTWVLARTVQIGREHIWSGGVAVRVLNFGRNFFRTLVKTVIYRKFHRFLFYVQFFNYLKYIFIEKVLK